MGCLEEVFERLPGRKAGLSDHSVSVCSMLLYSDVANVIKDNEEIDAFEVVVDDKQTAPESTQEVVNDNLDKEKDVRGRHLSRPHRPFWGPLAGGSALQAVRRCRR